MTFRILLSSALALMTMLLIGSDAEEYTNIDSDELIIASQPTLYRTRIDNNIYADNTIHVYDNSYIRNIYADQAIVYNSRTECMRVMCAYLRNAEIHSIVINQPAQSAPAIACNSYNSHINTIYVTNIYRPELYIYLRDVPISTFVRFAIPGGHVHTNTPSNVIVENGDISTITPTYLHSIRIQEQIDMDIQTNGNARDGFLTPQKRKRNTDYAPHKIPCLESDNMETDDSDSE